MSNISQPDVPMLQEGLCADDIKQIPKVRAFLEAIINDERNKAFEQGYSEGLLQGTTKAFEEAESQYKSEYQAYLHDSKAQFEAALGLLIKPVERLSEDVVESLVASFKGCLAPVLTNPSIYDDSLKVQIDKLVSESPHNNRDTHIYINEALNEIFASYFKELSDKHGIVVEVLKMDDLVRIESVAGSFRFSHKEYIEKALSGGCL
ncbi:hypothetical protein [Pseudoalteromonas marina]|uniref:Uncharacterized protein n=1 Tax=Pseudoalteromonas marina TaxID=267375 RepID=A0ABT9FCZ4_9GAMM|nr:hypothetical protein [Pseudoalteromonas marina]MDP2564336.1 hypothetical protein [Pseudoalteromonas marina]